MLTCISQRVWYCLMIQKYIYLFAFSSFKKKSQKMTSRHRSKYTANWLRPNTCVKKKLSLLEKTPKIIAISLGAWAVKTCLYGNEVCKVPQKLLLEKQRLVCVTHNLLVCVKFPLEFTSVVVGCSDEQTLVCDGYGFAYPYPGSVHSQTVIFSWTLQRNYVA